LPIVSSFSALSPIGFEPIVPGGLILFIARTLGLSATEHNGSECCVDVEIIRRSNSGDEPAAFKLIHRAVYVRVWSTSPETTFPFVVGISLIDAAVTLDNIALDFDQLSKIAKVFVPRFIATRIISST
jgi:hypothetical protein